MLSFLFSDPLPVGSPAPDWTLRDQDGNIVALSALRGKNVVLVFYPRDETPTCRAQLCEFRDAWEQAKREEYGCVRSQSTEGLQSRWIS